jgi:pyruvate,water dikinase
MQKSQTRELPPSEEGSSARIEPERCCLYRLADHEKDTAAKSIIGHAASAGLAEGRAKLIRGFKNLESWGSDVVLVCPSLSPETTVLFPKVLALITDTGGILSTAAAVARHYGIPAVVGTSCATRRIQDGDLVRVDGGKGQVTVIGAARTGPNP